MAVKIRLARRGRKKMAMYDIVVAESTSPRDGRFIEKIGTYNPNTDPSTVALKSERAVYWLMVGAQPTDTARSVLSHEGIMYRKHLQVGVNKGAISQDQADEKFTAWKEDKENRKATTADTKTQTKEQARTARLEAERKVSETRTETIAKKNRVEEAPVEEREVFNQVPVAEIEEAHAAESIGEMPVDLTAAVATPTEAAPIEAAFVTETPIADIAPPEEVAAVEQASDAPVSTTETPAAEAAPVAETPAVEEAPGVDAPVAETPVAEATPTAEEAPGVDAPGVDAPGVDAPAQLSSLASEEAPGVETPADVVAPTEETPAAEPAEAAAPEESPATEDVTPSVATENVAETEVVAPTEETPVGETAAPEADEKAVPAKDAPAAE